MEWLPEIGDDDIETLVDALEAWENKGVAGEMMGDLFGAILCKDDPAARADMDRRTAAENLKRQRERDVRKERSIVLRAKLLMLRDRRRVEQTIRVTSAAPA